MSSECINTVFEERQKFILIGLTGRTGSGCSTTSDLLSKTFKELNPPKPKNDDFKNNEERKYKIIYDYASQNWDQNTNFRRIKVADILTSFIIEAGQDALEKYLSDEYGFDDFNNQQYIKNVCDKFQDSSKTLAHITSNKYTKTNQSYQFITEKLGIFKAQLKKFLNEKDTSIFINLFQEIGNNLRYSGNLYTKAKEEGAYKPTAIYTIPERLNKFIKIIKKYNDSNNKNTFIVVDAIRNPFEARYFHDRYSAFYLFSIKCNEDERKERLRQKYNLNNDQIDNLDNTEYSKHSEKESKLLKFTNLNVKECISNSDIHLYNPNGHGQDLSKLTKEILKYISLIMHPGLITPSTKERLMQIAYNTKLNSGCISRQVGAVVTDENYSVKAGRRRANPLFVKKCPCSAEKSG